MAGTCQGAALPSPACSLLLISAGGSHRIRNNTHQTYHGLPATHRAREPREHHRFCLGHPWEPASPAPALLLGVPRCFGVNQAFLNFSGVLRSRTPRAASLFPAGCSPSYRQRRTGAVWEGEVRHVLSRLSPSKHQGPGAGSARQHAEVCYT